MKYDNVSMETRSQSFFGIETLSPKISPDAPGKLKEFKRMSKQHQQQEAVKFFSQYEIKEYIDTKWRNELFNRDNYLYLIDILHKISESDSNRQLVKNKITQFGQAIKNVENPFRALLIKIDNQYQKQEEQQEWEE